MSYDAFISYSHAGDRQLAPAIQSGLQRLAKPWWRLRALDVFRDETGLTVNPDMWGAIESALGDSDWFVLLCSPESAQSAWVNKEIEQWCTTKSPDHILPVLTDGSLAWDESRADFDPDSTALPPALLGRFPSEPFYLDMNWARTETDLDLRHSRFRTAIAAIAARIHGRKPEELETEDVLLHRRARRLARIGVFAILLFAASALVATAFAAQSAHRANSALAKERVATLNAQTARDYATEQTKRAEKSAKDAKAAEAKAVREDTLANSARLTADRFGANALVQKRVAELQRASAVRSASDANFQKAVADLQAANAEASAAVALEATAAAQTARDAALLQKALADNEKDQVDQQNVQISSQKTTATAHALAFASREAAGSGALDSSLLLARQASLLSDDPVTRSALISAGTSSTWLNGYLQGLNDVVKVAASSDGRLVAGADGNGTIELWSTTSLQRVGLTLHAIRPVVSGLALSPGGARVAITSTFGDSLLPIDGTTAEVVDVRSGRVLWKKDHSIGPLTFDPTGHLLTLGGSPISVVSASTGALVAQLNDSENDFNQQAAFDPTGRRIAVAVNGGVAVWDLATKTIIFGPVQCNDPYPLLLSTINQESVSIAWERDGHHISTTATDVAHPLCEYDLGTGEVAASAPGQGVQLVASQGRTRIVGRDGSGQLTLLDVSDPSAPWNDLHLSTAGSSFAFAGNDLVVGDSRHPIQLWDIGDVPAADLTQSDNSIFGAATAVSSDGSTVAMTSTDGRGIAINTSTDGVFTRQRIIPAFGQAFALSGNGRALAVLSAPGVTIFDTSTGAERQRLRSTGASCTGGFAGSFRIAVSPDGRTVAAACATFNFGTFVDVWRIGRGARHVPHNLPALFANASLDVTNDGRIALSGCVAGGDTCGLGSKTLVVDTHATVVLSLARSSRVAWDSAGHTLAVADGTRIELFAGRRLAPIAQITTAGTVSAVRFSADGNTVAATVDEAGAVGPCGALLGANVTYSWDVASLESYGSFCGTGSSFALSARMNRLVSTVVDGSAVTTRQWSLAAPVWIARACRDANRDLSLSELGSVTGKSDSLPPDC